MIFANRIQVISYHLEMILWCHFYQDLENRFYLKKLPTFCIQFSWARENSRIKRAPQVDSNGFHIICPIFTALLSGLSNVYLAQIRCCGKIMMSNFKSYPFFVPMIIFGARCFRKWCQNQSFYSKVPILIFL